MAEMLYLFEERLIHRFHTEGPGKSARAEAEREVQEALRWGLAV